MDFLVCRDEEMVWNFRESTDLPLLHLMVQYGETSLIRLVVSNECINALADESGRPTTLDFGSHSQSVSPLGVAVTQNNSEIVKLLIDRGADVNQPQILGGYAYTPLSIACARGNVNAAAVLFENENLQPMAVTKDSVSWTAFHEAVKFGDLNIVEMFLRDPRFNLVHLNRVLEIPVKIAVENEHADIVKRLLEIDTTNINSLSNETHTTPLQYAIVRGNLQVLDALLECSAVELDAKDDAGNTVLHFLHKAIDEGHAISIARRLSICNVNYHARNQDGKTPLELLRDNGWLKAEGFVHCLMDLSTQIRYGHTKYKEVVRNLFLDCPVCMEKKRENHHFRCYHSVCIDCHGRLNPKSCPMCRT